jgi:hypothetical protein
MPNIAVELARKPLPSSDVIGQSSIAGRSSGIRQQEYAGADKLHRDTDETVAKQVSVDPPSNEVADVDMEEGELEDGEICEENKHIVTVKAENAHNQKMSDIPMLPLKDEPAIVIDDDGGSEEYIDLFDWPNRLEQADRSVFNQRQRANYSADEDRWPELPSRFLPLPARSFTSRK